MEMYCEVSNEEQKFERDNYCTSWSATNHYTLKA